MNTLPAIGDAMSEEFKSHLFYSAHDRRIEQHYANARQKHPYFCDIVTRDLWKVKDVQENIARIRQYIAEDVKRHEVEALSLLICETREFEEAMTLKDHAAAIEELYDIVAVCLRTIDVLEGRQKLGKPQEMKK